MASLRQLNFPEYTVAVEVDDEKCVGPFRCGKCLRNCPAAVFRTYPKKRVKGKICKDWAVEAFDDTFCWGCGVCTKICPAKAITIARKK